MQIKAIVRGLAACLWLSMCASPTKAEILIGSVVSQQGAAAISGVEFLRGTIALIDSVNSQGGVNGQRLRLVTGDDGAATGSAPEKTVTEFNRIFRSHSPLAFVNGSGTPNMEALIKDGTVIGTGVPVVGPFSLSHALRARGLTNLFFVRTGSKEEASRMVQQAVSMGMKRVALVYVSNNFGKELHALAREALTAHPEIAVKAYEVPSSGDITEAVVNDVVLQKSQMILMLIPGRLAPTLIKSYRSKGGAGFMVTSSAASADQIVASMGSDLARGVGVMQVVPSVYRNDLSLVREFLSAMKAVNKEWQPTSYALEGYINAKVLVEGIRRMKGTRPSDLTSALRTIKGLDLGGLFVDLSDPQKSGLRFVDIGVIGKDGRLKM